MWVGINIDCIYVHQGKLGRASFEEVPPRPAGIRRKTMSDIPTISTLRAIAQPDDYLARANAEHWSVRLYLRHLSIHVTRLLIPTGISANGVTWLMVLIGVAGAGMLAIGQWWALLICAFLMQFQVLVDCSD